MENENSIFRRNIERLLARHSIREVFIKLRDCQRPVPFVEQIALTMVISTKSAKIPFKTLFQFSLNLIENKR